MNFPINACQVSLLLLPSVDSFEEHLLTLLEDDLFSENNVSQRKGGGGGV